MNSEAARKRDHVTFPGFPLTFNSFMSVFVLSFTLTGHAFLKSISYRFTYYRAQNKGMQILLSNSQAGPGKKVKQEQEENFQNHVQAFIPDSVFCHVTRYMPHYSWSLVLLALVTYEGGEEREAWKDGALCGELPKT